MFNGSQIRQPVRILDELEVLKLSGLEEQWSNTHLNDAERLPERVIRDYCGNSFHPKLIGSALGEDHVLRRWVNGEITERTGEVASKNTVLQVYTRLCQEVEQLSHKQGIKLGMNLVKDFPFYILIRVTRSDVLLSQESMMSPFMGQGCQSRPNRSDTSFAATKLQCTT